MFYVVLFYSNLPSYELLNFPAREINFNKKLNKFQDRYVPNTARVTYINNRGSCKFQIFINTI